MSLHRDYRQLLSQQPNRQPVVFIECKCPSSFTCSYNNMAGHSDSRGTPIPAIDIITEH